MATAAVELTRIPPHVDPALVVDFDYMAPAGIEESGDVYRAFARLHEGPDVQWTPHYGGHWIATRAEDIKWIQETHQSFSNTEKAPPKGSCPFMPPITFDPPEHTKYRAVLNPHFAKRHIEETYEPNVRAVTIGLIEGILASGATSCEFVSEFSTIAPLKLFWDLVNLPQERRGEFLQWGRWMAGYGTAEERVKAQVAVGAFLSELLDERYVHPGPDVFTGISKWRDNPRFSKREEIVGMAQLVFFGGLDTVASMTGFSMWRLAERPDLQQRLKADPAVIPAAVEELLRRHGLSNTCRMVRHDMEHKGASLKAGELIMTVNGLSGIDAKRYDDPFKVDFDRGPVGHNSLGNGPHKCVGQHLARLELRVFLEEWTKRMPICRLDPEKPAPRSHAGPVNGVDHLYLTWDSA
ncbi:MAG: cytochrome P450 [Novosphingobium sp.]